MMCPIENFVLFEKLVASFCFSFIFGTDRVLLFQQMESDSSWDLCEEDEDYTSSTSNNIIRICNDSERTFDTENDDEKKNGKTTDSNIATEASLSSLAVQEDNHLENISSDSSLSSPQIVKSLNLLATALDIQRHPTKNATVTFPTATTATSATSATASNNNNSNDVDQQPPVVVDFQHSCTTPRVTPTNFMPIPEGLLAEWEDIGRKSVEVDAAAVTAAKSTVPATSEANHSFFSRFNFKWDHNTLMVATLVASAFNLGALTTFMMMHLVNKTKTKTHGVSKAGSRTSSTKRKFKSSRTDINAASLATARSSSFLLSKLQELDPFEDHAVEGLREEVLELILGTRRSRL